jgi:hypothetical protein
VSAMLIGFYDKEITQRERQTYDSILCRTFERCLRMLQNSIACFQELRLSFM